MDAKSQANVQKLVEENGNRTEEFVVVLGASDLEGAEILGGNGHDGRSELYGSIGRGLVETPRIPYPGA